MALLEAFGAPLPGLVPSKEAKALLARGALRHEKLCATLKDERIAPQLRAAKEQLSTCVDEPILNAVEASLSASRLGVANVLDEMVAACEDGLAQAACGAKEDAHETLDRAVGAARQAQRRLHATLTAALQPCEAAITDMAALAAQAPQAAIEAASRALEAGCAQAARELATGLDAGKTPLDLALQRGQAEAAAYLRDELGAVRGSELGPRKTKKPKSAMKVSGKAKKKPAGKNSGGGGGGSGGGGVATGIQLAASLAAKKVGAGVAGPRTSRGALVPTPRVAFRAGFDLPTLSPVVYGDSVVEGLPVLSATLRGVRPQVHPGFAGAAAALAQVTRASFDALPPSDVPA